MTATLIPPAPAPAALLLGVVADTHDNLPAIREVAAAFRARNVAFVLHAGDVVSPEALAPLASFAGALAPGNNDDAAVARAAQEMGWQVSEVWEGQLDGTRAAMTHGHRRDLLTAAIRARPDLLVVGHTHRASDSAVAGVRVVNPGALHRASAYSAGVYDTRLRTWESVSVAKVARGF